ncbi:uncharacterized protein LOC131619538 [Vicia villosa]|uniref:uncharacterized protein LOC131619538 n=1 Tax=Vicia villosa TaxID=3911 RepID=UPI00273ABEAB|nr:uncharacterized protein LOC131619538 [Vicia villosa]
MDKGPLAACGGIFRDWQANHILSFNAYIGEGSPVVAEFLATDVKSIILDICTNEDSRTAGRFAVMLDVIWNNRNNAIWNNESEEASKLGQQAFYRWQDWFSAQNGEQSGESAQPQLIWVPPDTGTAWDSNLLPVVEAEAVALQEAIHGAIENQLDKVIFESDSLRVVQAIHSNHSGNSEFSVIILSIQRLLQCYSNFEVKFIKRQTNMVAHSLAKAANSWSRRSNFNVPPPCIEHILINEMC